MSIQKLVKVNFGRNGSKSYNSTVCELWFILCCNTGYIERRYEFNQFDHYEQQALVTKTIHVKNILVTLTWYTLYLRLPTGTVNQRIKYLNITYWIAMKATHKIITQVGIRTGK